jgi:acetylornithine deacetylase
LQIRLVTHASIIKEVLESVVAGRASVEYFSVSEPVRMLALEGFDSCIVRFTTDVPQLAAWGQPLLLGPGSILDAHTEHERVTKRELSEAVKLYVSLVKTLKARVSGDARHVGGVCEVEGALER